MVVIFSLGKRGPSAFVLALIIQGHLCILPVLKVFVS